MQSCHHHQPSRTRSGAAASPACCRGGAVRPVPRRGGAVIILSLALLMALMFLGLFFFAFMDDESISAETYAETDRFYVDNRALLNAGLEQVIVSTDSSAHPYSALTGSQYSLLAHILGIMNDDGSPQDFQPYNGGGLRVFNQGGTIQVDANNDGTSDYPLSQLRLNGSPLANGTLTAAAFDPDVGYTYPDLNALFLYHESVDAGGELIIKPSFDAPGILYAVDGSDTVDGFGSNTHAISKERVLRPHAGHQYAGPDDRYLSTATTGATGANPTGSGDRSRLIQPFEFTSNYPSAPTRYGVYNGNLSDYSDLHVDADGDGNKDSFLIDLDAPLITFPDGRQAKPLHFWRIEDADGLVNLNTAGDMPLYRLAERRATPLTRDEILEGIFSDARFLTGGNYGLSPSEINPGVALLCDPADTAFVDNTNQMHLRLTDQISGYYMEQAGFTAMTDIRTDVNRLQLANTELLWLLTGRHQYDNLGNALGALYDVPGRYGESSLIANVAPRFAAAGTTGTDDDDDSNAGQRPGGGRAYNTEQFPRRNGPPPELASPVIMPPAVHPLDGTGHAQWLVTQPGAGMKRQFRNSTDANNPSRWLYYNALSTPQLDFVLGIGSAIPLWQYQVAGGAGVSPWVAALAVGYLQAHDSANPIDAFADEPDELVVDDTDAAFANPDDQPFDVSEIAALQLSNSDWSRVGRASRLRSLAPVNFDLNYLAEQIRRQFTVLSWDRPEFSYTWDNVNRPWEVNNAVPATASTIEFPPRFGTGASLVNATDPDYANSGAIVANDPLRPELRRLLYVDLNPTGFSGHPQQRLQLNGILSDGTLNGAGGESCFDANGNPRYRPLVPHPEFDSTTDATFTPNNMVHSHTAALPHTFASIAGSKQAQEWWARYDRQRLARDIYTLLWLLGSTADSVGSNPYTPEQIEEMAQFAVNAVDAMDHDNVITAFDYDPDLSDGWDTTPFDNGATSSLERAYGLETQALTFSEALWINSKQITSAMPSDHPATLWDDQTGDRHFLFMELRNTTPFNVRLGNGTYQIGRVDDTTVPSPVPPASIGRTVTLDGVIASGLTVGPGANFLVGTHSDSSFVETTGNTVQPAIFRLDYTADSTKATDLTYTALVPYLSEANPPGGTGADLATARAEASNPLCDLDLCHPRDRTTTQRFSEATTQAVGYFMTAPPAGQLDLVLRRKMNMQADGVINDTANDWVEIDRIRVPERNYQLLDNSAASGNADSVQTQFSANVRSRERREPFYAHATGEGGIDNTATNPFFRHTLGGVDPSNSGTDPSTQPPDDTRKPSGNSLFPSGQQFQIWQPHFDRGFTSIYDLLSVQLLSPDRLIYHERMGTPEGGLVETDSSRMTGLHTAGLRFQFPEPNLPAHLSAAAGEHYENRWYRLLEFLAVPSRTSDEISDDLALRRRLPGRVNLNTLRTEAVAGAVINDPAQLTLTSTTTPTQDQYNGASRNWYDELRRARDGYDATGTLYPGGIYPPGTPFANPFRPLTFDDRVTVGNPLDPSGRDPLRNTLLRRGVAGTLTNFDQIGLFEARTPNDAVGNPAANRDQVDFHTKQRILSRIANLTTNRSHVFVIWGGFQLHEAHQNSNGNVQIGARMDDIPRYRELIVVDMSRLEEAYNSATGTFDYSAFVVHREVLP